MLMLQSDAQQFALKLLVGIYFCYFPYKWENRNQTVPAREKILGKKKYKDFTFTTNLII